MKRCVSFLLILVLLFSLSSCASKRRTDITREEIIAAYEAAGYDVSSRIYDEKTDLGQVSFVKAEDSDGDYIYFAIFDNEEDAKAYKKEYFHPGMMALFSAIFGDPSWQRMKVYGCIVAQYDDPDFIKPFQKLMKTK